MALTVVILTLNEERHLARAIESVKDCASSIYVVDSGSDDRTVQIAESFGANVMVNPFVNQAQQFNWALDQLPKATDWILRLDADEVVSPSLSNSLQSLDGCEYENFSGFLIKRNMTFLRKKIRFGGVFPVPVLRVFRFGRARSENKWMDEHIEVEGAVGGLGGEILDDSLLTLSEWIAKHNNYSSREAIEVLNSIYNFMPPRVVSELRLGRATRAKRWLKLNIYMRLPVALRAISYFVLRFIVFFGFLDGFKGGAFHFLQGFWYRFLVDLKVQEVRDYINLHGEDPVTAIHKVLKIEIKL